ncbi:MULTISPECIES: HepT-like ribonuclease domain-containing protein [Planktothricoides]|uniref:DUF86 domain-containing protein n=2 Tax=Planktothricoides raciborskii TaxID=132608 RepID=A0AAU8JJ82_9CYAN|nr:MULTISPECIES: DUF86 domain-containing protein [Planktothricoides]KOR34271.1 hypothetical protein AM228_24975 [Planktothricoides sp. SR001]MBD2544504.1 DUF86 domain-containing protein [Planktothricoides raciborskii FACHB-1370]MBD2585241.1 DUF86 domain-containing protein [Planktothricoides raciborskii FACHB-1261]
MSRSNKDYLLHIMDEIIYLLTTSENLEKEAFGNNETFKRSFVRSLEVIGEATKKLSEDFRSEYPEMPWRRMAGMRDKLIHDYFGIDYDVVWDVVKNEIPNLNWQITKIIKELEDRQT